MLFGLAPKTLRGYSIGRGNMGSCRGSLWEMGYGFLDEDHGYYRISNPIVGDGSQAESFLKQMILFDAGGGIRTRDFGDAPSDQPHRGL